MELIEAAQSGILQKVKDVIINSTIPLDCQWIDYAALNNAITYGHVIVAEYLLDIGCRVDMDKDSDLSNDTPLHNAVILEHVELVEKLLKKEASIVAKNSDGNTPLHLAFLLRNEIIMDTLLETLKTTKNFINIKNNQGLSHMHIACTRKHNKVVESFVASGVDLNDCVDEDSFLWSGYSPLHFAIEFRSINAVKAILNSTAQTSMSITDSIHGLTPLGLAQQQMKDLSAIVALLLNQTVENTDSLIKGKEVIKDEKQVADFQDEKKVVDFQDQNKAVDFQDEKKVTEFKGKKEVNEGSTSGLSSFHMACMENNADIVEHFINNGASVHQPVISHIDLFHLYTPLHLAVENKCKKTVEVLLKHGADVNLQNNDKMTPLHLALYVNDHNDKQDIIDYLYAAVESKLANPKDANNLSYLHIACTRNDLKTVTYLLDVGEDVNAQVQRNSRNVPNFTPLHFAVDYQHVEIAKLLIERGANVNRYSLEGTPLHLACKHGHSDLIGMLLNSRAKVDGTMTIHPLIEAYSSSKDTLLLDYVERLVSLGVDVDAKDVLGNTALHLFCSRCPDHVSCARFLLDLGANLNLENNEGQTAFELCSNSAVFYHHVQDIKALGIEVNPKNDACCQKMLDANVFDDETLERKKNQRTDEIICMKSIKLGKHVSLDDFLRLDPDDATLYAANEILRLVVSTKDITKCFPTYGYLIKLHYCKAVGSFGVRKKKGNFENSTETKRRCLS